MWYRAPAAERAPGSLTRHRKAFGPQHRPKPQTKHRPPPPQDFPCVGCSRRFETEHDRLIHINTSATGNHGVPPDEFPTMSSAFLVQFPASRRRATAAILHVPLMYASGPSSTVPELLGYTSGLEVSLAAAPYHTKTEHDSTTVATMDSQAGLDSSLRGRATNYSRRDLDGSTFHAGVQAAKVVAAIEEKTGKPVIQKHINAAHDNTDPSTITDMVGHLGNIVTDNVANRAGAEPRDPRAFDRRFHGVPPELCGVWYLTHNGAPLCKIRETLSRLRDCVLVRRIVGSTSRCATMTKLISSGIIHQDATAMVRSIHRSKVFGLGVR